MSDGIVYLTIISHHFLVNIYGQTSKVTSLKNLYLSIGTISQGDFRIYVMNGVCSLLNCAINDSDTISYENKDILKKKKHFGNINSTKRRKEKIRLVMVTLLVMLFLILMPDTTTRRFCYQFLT